MGDTKRGLVVSKFIKEKYPINKLSKIFVPADGNLILASHLHQYDEVLVFDPQARAYPKKKNIKLRKKGFYAENKLDFKPDLIVGLHPDHATGEIIEYGLKTGIPICIVPCCALGKFSDKIERRSYAQWMNILKQKIPNHKITDLPIRGRNKIIWI